MVKESILDDSEKMYENWKCDPGRGKHHVNRKEEVNEPLRKLMFSK